MLIAVPANAVRFSSRRWQPPAEHILITERAGLVERQRGAGLVSSNRKNANGSTVGGAIPQPAYGWRCPASAGSLQALSHSIRRARLRYEPGHCCPAAGNG